MLARNLLYTGVTRGKQLVVLVGQKKALAIAVKNHGTRRRWSKLRDWLRASNLLSATVDVLQANEMPIHSNVAFSRTG
jgi:exodeoxyribonuclease V alpha subunit